ncbi:adenylate/guanylate cyclase domain-containing protein [Treponema bryantii]|uniref:adenylate/guanylate cyclase domain-containing protein n=1 Tax=Treponema bryantii TaxID=163 RepID=UPI0003B42CDA|nr:adenylate/guanylate cyclase domain-containing protein [Treponema bryantii]
MAKKILILESSATMQKLFKSTLDSKQYSIVFESEAKEIFNSLYESSPDLFLLNCSITEPGAFEIVKLVRTLPDFKELPVALYSNLPTSLDEEFAKECGATSFIRLDAESLVQNIDQLAEVESDNPGKSKSAKSKKLDKALLFSSAVKLLSQKSFNSIMTSKIADLIGQIDDLEEMIKSYLLMIAQVCEVPLAAMYILENDGPHGYYLSAKEVPQKDISDFLNVCEKDFDKNMSGGISAKNSAKEIDSENNLERFFSSEIQLSSYEYRVLKTDASVLATVHIVAQGNIISDKLNYLDFCINNAVEVFDKALIVEKKIYFEKRIRRAFSRFVPEQIIDSLVKQADDTNQKVGVGETRSVAILFSDIRSFTNISEKNRADVLVAFLNRYFSTMVEIIKKHGGTIDKFIGDAIMAEFGTPVSYEDNCRRAVMAAYEMRDALPTVEMGDLVMPDGMVFNIGIGIHYGEVIVGSIGSKDKTDYSVIGDNVNLASRLEGLTKTYGSQILVSESVRADAGEDSFCFRHLDDVRVKGKKNAVPIYAVDRSPDEFPAEYKNAYIKGMELYKQGIWNLAKDYFVKALEAVENDKAAKLMLDRCEEFIKNPPENWDGAIAFMTK